MAGPGYAGVEALAGCEKQKPAKASTPGSVFGSPRSAARRRHAPLGLQRRLRLALDGDDHLLDGGELLEGLGDLIA